MRERYIPRIVIWLAFGSVLVLATSALRAPEPMAVREIPTLSEPDCCPGSFCPVGVSFCARN